MTDASLRMPGDADYARLFAAYATGLLGSGVAVVGLALLAFDLAGDNAGAVVATALSIKTLAYVLVAPLAEAATGGLPKRPLMIALDLLRAAAILALPFAEALWQLYLAVFVFTAASAAFTPAYQAVVPALLTDPDDYARALAKSRVANELESAASPLVASALLLVFAERGLFLAAIALFLVSAGLVARANLPRLPAPEGAFAQRLAAGPRLLAATPGLRALAPLAFAAALGTAMVMVNTVVIVQGDLALGSRAVALALAVFGAGSVAGALAVPVLRARAGEQPLMLGGAALVALGLLGGVAGAGHYGALLALWAAIGAGAALAMTPAPFLLLRLAPSKRRAAAYAALFALGNLALLAAYPLAGAAGAEKVPNALGFAAFAILAAAAALAAARAFPKTAP